MENKTQLIKKIKKEFVFLAIPKAMNKRTKSQLEKIYKEGKELGLTK